jgi:actin-related protein
MSEPVKDGDEYSENPAEEKSQPTEQAPVQNNSPQEEFTIIIDIGQGTTKVGFAGDEKPIVFETITGTPKYKNLMADVSGMVQSIYVGDDCTRMRGVLKIDRLINRGNVMNWEQYYAVLNHIFNNVLRVNASKCNVIYLVPPLTPPDIAQYYARVLFETHHCRSVAVIDTASTSVFSTGETTALSLEMGAGLTHVVPVMNGQLYQPSIQRLNLAGSDIEEYLKALMTQYGAFEKQEILKDIKESCVELTLDPVNAARDPSKTKNFNMPDGTSLQVNSYVATNAAEVMFNPTLLGYNCPSLSQAVINSVRMVDPYYWRPLLKRIIISGGTSLLKGLKERLEMEIERLIDQLGPLPAPVEEPKQESKSTDAGAVLFGSQKKISEPANKMVQMDAKVVEGKKETNCPKCGETIDTSESNFCPYCGAEVVTKKIDIIGAKKLQYPTKCPNPKCGKKLTGKDATCPFCGRKLNPVVVEDKADKSELKLLKKTAASDKEIKTLQKTVADEYGTEDDLKELAALDKKLTKKIAATAAGPRETPKPLNWVDPNKVINVILSDSQRFAAFKGAAILGTLPTFKQYMIDYNTFSQNANLVVIDFSKILNLQ